MTSVGGPSDARSASQPERGEPASRAPLLATPSGGEYGTASAPAATAPQDNEPLDPYEYIDSWRGENAMYRIRQTILGHRPHPASGVDSPMSAPSSIFTTSSSSSRNYDDTARIEGGDGQQRTNWGRWTLMVNKWWIVLLIVLLIIATVLTATGMK